MVPGYGMDTDWVPRDQVRQRAKALAMWGWPDALIESMVQTLVDDLPDNVTLEALEQRLECLPDLVESIDLKRWGQACETLCPELYGEPPQSPKASDSIPGSRSRQWRLAERYRVQVALHNPRDSLGVAETQHQQLELFC